MSQEQRPKKEFTYNPFEKLDIKDWQKTTEGDVKRTYKKLCLVYHPDKQGGSTKLFQELVEHYEEALRCLKHWETIPGHRVPPWPVDFSQPAASLYADRDRRPYQAGPSGERETFRPAPAGPPPRDPFSRPPSAGPSHRGYTGQEQTRRSTTPGPHSFPSAGPSPRGYTGQEQTRRSTTPGPHSFPSAGPSPRGYTGQEQTRRSATPGPSPFARRRSTSNASSGSSRAYSGMGNMGETGYQPMTDFRNMPAASASGPRRNDIFNNCYKDLRSGNSGRGQTFNQEPQEQNFSNYGARYDSIYRSVPRSHISTPRLPPINQGPRWLLNPTLSYLEIGFAHFVDEINGRQLVEKYSLARLTSFTPAEKKYVIDYVGEPDDILVLVDRLSRRMYPLIPLHQRWRVIYTFNMKLYDIVNLKWYDRRNDDITRYNRFEPRVIRESDYLLPFY